MPQSDWSYCPRCGNRARSLLNLLPGCVARSAVLSGESVVAISLAWGIVTALGGALLVVAWVIFLRGWRGGWSFIVVAVVGLLIGLVPSATTGDWGRGLGLGLSLAIALPIGLRAWGPSRSVRTPPGHQAQTGWITLLSWVEIVAILAAATIFATAEDTSFWIAWVLTGLTAAAVGVEYLLWRRLFER